MLQKKKRGEGKHDAQATGADPFSFSPINMYGLYLMVGCVTFSRLGLVAPSG